MKRIEVIEYLKRIFVLLIATLLICALVAPISFGLWENRESKQKERFNLLILNQTGEIMVGQLGDETFSLQEGESKTFELTCKENETVYYDMTLRLFGEDVFVLDYPRIYVTRTFSSILDSATVDSKYGSMDTGAEIYKMVGDKTSGSVIYTVTYDDDYRDALRTQNWEDSEWTMPFEID